LLAAETLLPGSQRFKPFAVHKRLICWLKRQHTIPFSKMPGTLKTKNPACISWASLPRWTMNYLQNKALCAILQEKRPEVKSTWSCVPGNGNVGFFSC
jgi:hypothetical protein